MNPVKGASILRANELLTGLFVATAIVAVIAFSNPWKVIAASVAIACFSVGVVVFLWGY